jgi:hypothetical protein
MNIDFTQIIIAFLAGLPVLITAITALIVSLRTQTQITVLKDHVNSKMDKLLEATGEAEGLKGEERGRIEERERPR